MNDEDMIEAVHQEMTLQGFPAWGYRVETVHLEEFDATDLRIEGMIHRDGYRGWQKFVTRQFVRAGGVPNEARRKVAQDVAARFARDFRGAAA